jgi:hypothetical protein
MMANRQAMVFLGLGGASGLSMALAVLLFLGPVSGPPPMMPFQDKIFHVIAFAALAGPGVLVLPARYLWFWLAHMVVLGAGIEWVQARMGEGRTGDPVDFVADCVGIALAYGVGRWIRARFEQGAPA